MPSRNWIMFLVAIGCAWAIGFFMGDPGLGNAQYAGSALGENAPGTATAHAGSMALNASLADAESKSIFSFAERLRGISNHPSARWRNAQFARLADEIPIADIPRFLDEVKTYAGSDNAEVTRLLFARWAEVDPRGAAEFGLRSKNWYGASTAIAEWTATDPIAALAWVNGVPAGPDRNYLIPGIIPALARIDPARAFQFLQEHPGEKSGGYHFSEIFARWPGKDVSAALAAVDEMSAGYPRNLAMAALAGGWAKSDPDAALAWALKVPNRDVRRMAVDGVLRGWEKVDVEAMIARGRAMPDERDRSAILASLVGVTANRDPEKALAMLADISAPELRDGATASVIYALISTDVSRAATLAESLAGRLGDQPITQVVERLQFVDPERAAALSLKVSQSSSNPIGGVLAAWLRSSPNAALAWLEKTKLPPNSTQWNARNSLARWAGENIPAATALVQDRSSSENLKWVVNAAIQGIAAKTPEAAAELSAGIAAAVIDGSALGAIGSNWAEKDPKAASQWVARLPETPHLRGAAWGVANTWAAADPAAAAAWIDGLQPGMLRDGAAAAFSSVTARTDPEAAIVWANTIQNEASRHSAMNEVLRIWVPRDPAAVKAWAANQPSLPAEVRSNVPQ